MPPEPVPLPVASTVPTAGKSSVLARAWAWTRHHLPEGNGLPTEDWEVRHRAVVFIILGHAVGLTMFGLVQDWPPVIVFSEGILLAGIGLLAAWPRLNRRMRSGLAAFGCVASSSMLVQFWGGVIEGHFHFFVMVALISLYQDWLPFLLAISFVAVDHGLVGTLASEWVYNHPDALADPWRWAVIHATMVLAESAALIVVWRANEQARMETDRILRSAGEALVGVDAECKVTFANPAAVQMVGGDKSQIVGRPLYTILLGNDGRPMFSGPEVLRQNPGAFSLEAWLAGNKGKVPVEVLCTPIEGHGHSEGAVVAMRDLTDRLRAEAERNQSARQSAELEQLREVDSFKTRFMNMAAHELNTPLTPIKVQVHLLKQRANDPEPAPAHTRSIGILDRNVGRLSSLVQDLLDSARLQSKGLPTAPRDMDLSHVLHEAVDSFQPVAGEDGKALDLTAPAKLDCVADPQRIMQVMANLLSNAVKFTPRGGRIHVTAVQRDHHIRVSVQDTGLGLTPEQTARLFQPFEQVHEHQVATHHGSGLGLYISKGIVEAHGGRIWVESAGPGQGSTFAFEIPVAGPAPAPSS